jgi:circadian clock protein KaiC
MLGGAGFYRGSSILVSGTAGTGKTSLAAHFASATCRAGERCLYLAFEESPAQLARNMRSIGIDIEPWLKKGLLRLQASRPSLHGLEMHLACVHKQVEEFSPKVVIVDPISNLVSAGNELDTQAMLLRLVDYLKGRGITAMFINLTGGGRSWETTDVGVSSLIDTWILLRDIELGGERNRGVYVLKSRGMKHSNQIREFLITPKGIELAEVYVGPEGVLTGSMRAAQEAREKAAEIERQQSAERRQRELAIRRTTLAAQIQALQAEVAAVEEEASVSATQDASRARTLEEERAQAAARRAGLAANAAVKTERQPTTKGKRR